jgi:hypothetical protein
LVSSYSSLESKLGKGQEELREAIMGEIEAEAFSNRPETAGQYELPEDFDASLADDPDLDWWANFAWENGFSQDEFNEGLARLIPAGPDLDAEMEKLGDNASARIESVGLWAQKNVPEELSHEIMRLGETAEGVELLEYFMGKLEGGGISGEATSPTVMGLDELRTMMRDPRYFDPARRDPGYVKQVDEGFAKLYK